MPPTAEQRVTPITEDLFIDPEAQSETPDLIYRDGSSRWPWLHAIMVWIQRRPQFYQSDWQAASDHLLKFLVESNKTETIYIWNRATTALNAYRKYAAKNYRVSDYGLRKGMYELFTDSRMAQSAYEFIHKQLLISKEIE